MKLITAIMCFLPLVLDYSLERSWLDRRIATCGPDAAGLFLISLIRADDLTGIRSSGDGRDAFWFKLLGGCST
jgi:hypothetical protein